MQLVILRALAWLGLLLFVILRPYLDAEPVLPDFEIPRYVSIEERVVREALEHQIPPSLALRVAWEESRFRPRAVHKNRNRTRDWGVMQLNDRYYSGDALTDVDQNIHEGVMLIARHYQRYKKFRRSICAYRGGCASYGKNNYLRN